MMRRNTIAAAGSGGLLSLTMVWSQAMYSKVLQYIGVKFFFSCWLCMPPLNPPVARVVVYQVKYRCL